jgi:hypothetical protein
MVDYRWPGFEFESSTCSWFNLETQDRTCHAQDSPFTFRHSTALHHKRHMTERGDVRERIAIRRDKISVRACRDLAHLALPADQLGGVDSGGRIACIEFIPISPGV